MKKLILSAVLGVSLLAAPPAHSATTKLLRWLVAQRPVAAMLFDTASGNRLFKAVTGEHALSRYALPGGMPATRVRNAEVFLGALEHESATPLAQELEARLFHSNTSYRNYLVGKAMGERWPVGDMRRQVHEIQVLRRAGRAGNILTVLSDKYLSIGARGVGRTFAGQGYFQFMTRLSWDQYQSYLISRIGFIEAVAKSGK